MKRRGFTLAEVLIALALVGVLASLTVPTFVSSSRNRANAAKLATIVSAMENAFATMISAEAVQDLSETDFGMAADPTVDDLGTYVKIVGSTNTIAGAYPVGTQFRENFVPPNVTRVYQTKNGAFLIYSRNNVNRPDSDDVPETSSIGRLAIDVNADEGPNMWGRDLFYFRIGYDGILYPAGGATFGYLENGVAAENNCAQESLRFCTNMLIEDNYEINY